MMAEREGVIFRINGPVIEAQQVTGIYMGNIEENLLAIGGGRPGSLAAVQ